MPELASEGSLLGAAMGNSAKWRPGPLLARHLFWWNKSWKAGVGLQSGAPTSSPTSSPLSDFCDNLSLMSVISPFPSGTSLSSLEKWPVTDTRKETGKTVD